MEEYSRLAKERYKDDDDDDEDKLDRRPDSPVKREMLKPRDYKVMIDITFIHFVIYLEKSFSTVINIVIISMIYLLLLLLLLS